MSLFTNQTYLSTEHESLHESNLSVSRAWVSSRIQPICLQSLSLFTNPTYLSPELESLHESNLSISRA
ncbi:hypothetical protein RRG08_008520 [Elysia crispata]|uniref:Uncharacterized protein n=1 Tax=Elysia crispata TaxID=231223 RepID=A0AAE1AC43_9GAST|nr:hypothetical protein RRG08_008520 [Elysia crispata]